MPSSVLVGSDFPQFGQIVFVFITLLPPITEEESGKGYKSGWQETMKSQPGFNQG
jgi:hypothetical protein